MPMTANHSVGRASVAQPSAAMSEAPPEMHLSASASSAPHADAVKVDMEMAHSDVSSGRKDRSAGSSSRTSQ
eukprot:7272178-Prymnesium_polylepis.1